jgi:hypothetical protein
VVLRVLCPGDALDMAGELWSPSRKSNPIRERRKPETQGRADQGFGPVPAFPEARANEVVQGVRRMRCRPAHEGGGGVDEANVSTTQSQAQEDPWFQGEDEDEGGQKGSEQKKGKGKETPLRLVAAAASRTAASLPVVVHGYTERFEQADERARVFIPQTVPALAAVRVCRCHEKREKIHLEIFHPPSLS